MSSEVQRFCNGVASQQADATVSRPPLKRLSILQVEQILTVALRAFSTFAKAGKLLLAFRELRDALAIAFGWCIMDRGADIVRLRYSQLIISESTVSICKSLSKTARREADIQPMVTITSSNDNFCIIRLIRTYVQLAKDLGVDVRQGFLLRSVRIQARLGTPPGITACMPSAADLRNRLATLCTTAGVPRSGLHALRRGRAKHLRISGASRSTIQVFGAWRTPAMADHFSNAYPADDDYNDSE
jgi:integrase